MPKHNAAGRRARVRDGADGATRRGRRDTSRPLLRSLDPCMVDAFAPAIVLDVVADTCCESFK